MITNTEEMEVIDFCSTWPWDQSGIGKGKSLTPSPEKGHLLYSETISYKRNVMKVVKGTTICAFDALF